MSADVLMLANETRRKDLWQCQWKLQLYRA